MKTAKPDYAKKRESMYLILTALEKKPMTYLELTRDYIHRRRNEGFKTRPYSLIRKTIVELARIYSHKYRYTRIVKQDGKTIVRLRRDKKTKWKVRELKKEFFLDELIPNR